MLGCGENADTCQLNLPPTVVHNAAVGRIRKMVLLRNIYMDYIEANPERFRDFDFLVALDLDIHGTFYVDGMGMAGAQFREDPALQGLCANGVFFRNLGFAAIPLYLDPYAHKADPAVQDKLVQVGYFWTSPSTCSEEPWKVRSCFNGFTLYRLSSIVGKHYKLEEDGDGAVCEHVTFNEQLDRMYMAPYLFFVHI